MKHLNQRLYGDNFCFEKPYPHWKLFTLIRPLHLTTLAFVKEKNNGFAGNDRQETRIFVYLVDFVQLLPGANFAGGSFENSPDWDNICKIVANYPHFFFRHLPHGIPS